MYKPDMLSMDAFCYLPVKNSGTFILENLVICAICAEYMKRGVGMFSLLEIHW